MPRHICKACGGKIVTKRGVYEPLKNVFRVHYGDCEDCGAGNSHSVVARLIGDKSTNELPPKIDTEIVLKLLDYIYQQEKS